MFYSSQTQLLKRDKITKDTIITNRLHCVEEYLLFPKKLPSHRLNRVIVTVMVNTLTNKDEYHYYDSTFL